MPRRAKDSQPIGTALPAETASAEDLEPVDDRVRERGSASTMLPARAARSSVESVFMRLIATAGIVGIAVAIAAILASQHVQGWIIGLAVSLWSVVLAAMLWSSRRL